MLDAWEVRLSAISQAVRWGVTSRAAALGVDRVYSGGCGLLLLLSKTAARSACRAAARDVGGMLRWDRVTAEARALGRDPAATVRV